MLGRGFLINSLKEAEQTIPNHRKMASQNQFQFVIIFVRLSSNGLFHL